MFGEWTGPAGFWVGMLGLMVSVVGLGATYWQVKKTLRAAEAAQAAAEDARRKSLLAFQKFACSLVAIHLKELKQSVHDANWLIAAIRCEDAASLIAQLVPNSDMPSRLRKFEVQFRGLLADPKGVIAKKTWNSLMDESFKMIDRINSPFGGEGELS